MRDRQIDRQSLAVFGAIDTPARAILRAVDLRMFGRGQLAAVGCAVGMNLLVDALLAILEARGLTRR